MPNQQIEYQIVYADSVEGLAGIVNHYAVFGWQPTGGPVVTHAPLATLTQTQVATATALSWFQAVVRTLPGAGVTGPR